MLMKCVNVDRAQCRGWYTDSGPDCGFLTLLCRFSGHDDNKALASETTHKDIFEKHAHLLFLQGSGREGLHHSCVCTQLCMKTGQAIFLSVRSLHAVLR